MTGPDPTTVPVTLSTSGAVASAAGTGWVDRFNSKLVLVLLDSKYRPSTRNGRSLWGLYLELTYRPSNAADVITVPKGFPTDLASIPRWGWIVLPPDGPWVKAAVVHDFLYTTQGTGSWKTQPKGISRSHDYTREEADWILRDALENRGVSTFWRYIIWAAVRFGGGGAWNARRDVRNQVEVTDSLLVP